MNQDMVTIQFVYHEIDERDYTGVIINVLNAQQEVLAVYRNFDPKEIEKSENISRENWENIWENQTEEFEVGSLEMAKQIIESSQSYTEVKRIA